MGTQVPKARKSAPGCANMISFDIAVEMANHTPRNKLMHVSSDPLIVSHTQKRMDIELALY